MIYHTRKGRRVIAKTKKKEPKGFEKPFSSLLKKYKIYKL